MRLGGYFEVIAAGAMELQHAETASLADTFDIGDERSTIGLVDGSEAGTWNTSSLPKFLASS
ncbi:MAG TPA: hypothetical protein VFS58_02520 [Steroidobacteraceae bacterium]|nr:hypothetical protein [Steroidobacteraceae bacterium]